LLKKIAARAMQLPDRRYREFYAQRMVVDPDKRTRRANKVAAASPRYEPGVVAGVDEVFSALDNIGYARTPGFGRKWRARFADFSPTRPVAILIIRNSDDFNPPNDVPKGVHVAYFDAELVVPTPHIFEIVNNPVVLGAVARVLGATPTISYMAVWWSLPAGDGTAQQAENFHRDFDDWRFVKYIVYLTDVDEDSGPHIFIPGSHKQNKLLPIRRYTAEEIAGAFGQGNAKLFVGPAGTSFLENTYGFHRGLPAKSKPRLALAATYSLRVILYGPRAPIAAIGQNGIPADIDSYINRIYCTPAR
jgi:Phytanoyl-CoA dioxygenase (PhyH)